MSLYDVIRAEQTRAPLKQYVTVHKKQSIWQKTGTASIAAALFYWPSN